MRTVEKPWGSELIWAEQASYVAKILTINAGHRLSRQYHNVKDETFMVLAGILTLEVGQGDKMVTHHLHCGQIFHCAPKVIHRMICDSSKNEQHVRVMEVSTNHLDDVVRLEDDYKR